MATVMFNCKRCRVGKRIEYPHRESNGYRAYYYRMDGHRRVFPGDECACGNCGRRLAWEYLRAVLRPEHKCDARCTNARGHSCECSCGGKNHGIGWSLQLTPSGACDEVPAKFYCASQEAA